MQFPVSHPDDGLIDISIQEIVCLLRAKLSRRMFYMGVLGR